MNCDACKDRLVEYLLHELDEATHREVEQALTGCAECQRELALLSRMFESAANAPRPAFDESRRQTVMQQAARSARSASNRRETPWYAHPSFLMAASALLALGATIVLLQMRTNNDASNAPGTLALAREPAHENAAAQQDNVLALQQAAVNEAGLPQPEEPTGPASLDEAALAQPAEAAPAPPVAPMQRPSTGAPGTTELAARTERRPVHVERLGGSIGEARGGIGANERGSGSAAGTGSAVALEDAVVAESETIASTLAQTRGPSGAAPSAAAPVPSAAPAPVAVSALPPAPSGAADSYGRAESSARAPVRQADRNASETRGQRARNAAAEPQSRSVPAPEPRARDEASAAALSAEFAEESEADARQPLGDAPDDSSAELASGIALYRSARYAEAAAMLEHFVSGIDPSDPRAPEAQYHLGAALAALGESRRARFVLERFLTLYPAHSRSSSVRDALIELDRTEIDRQLAPAAEPLAPEQ